MHSALKRSNKDSTMIITQSHLNPLQRERQLKCDCPEKQLGELGLAPDKLEHRVMT